MNEIVPEKSVGDVPVSGLGEVVRAGESPRPGGPQVTFMGNTYDLVSLGALITGALTLFSCLTCGQGVYCLPLLPVILGLISLLAAKQSVNAERTRLWSWLGIAAGALILLLIVAAVGLYLAFLFLAIIAGAASNRG